MGPCRRTTASKAATPLLNEIAHKLAIGQAAAIWRKHDFAKLLEDFVDVAGRHAFPSPSRLARPSINHFPARRRIDTFFAIVLFKAVVKFARTLSHCVIRFGVHLWLTCGSWGSWIWGQ
jgi:hypothetical protein